MTTHPAGRQYRYRIAGLDGTVHELILSSAGVTGDGMFPHEQSEKWRYELRTSGVTVFAGSDLATPAHTSPDKAAASALFFLTVQPGDTDTGHFRGYTSRQLAWCRDHADSLGAALEAVQEAPAGLGACRIHRGAADEPERRGLRPGDLTRALHLIAPDIPVRTQAAGRHVFRMRLREADAVNLYLAGLNGSPPAWDRVGAWLSALTEIPVDVTAADVTEDPGTGERWAFVTVRPSGSVDAELADAVRADHPCDDRSCDIAVALEQGYPQVAASLLLGATDAPTVGALIDAGHAIVPANLERCRGWDEWMAYHQAYGRRCPSCGAHTYGHDSWTPGECAECLQPLGEPGTPPLAGGDALAARRMNQVMESEDWESDWDTGTWKAPRQLVPDPVSGFGNLGWRIPGASGDELFGDTPYREALAALDTYTEAAAANARAAESLEALLTVHGFDRDEALMSHIAAVRDGATRLQAHGRDARMGLFMRHGAGQEYHASGKDAAASAFRIGDARLARDGGRTEGSTP